MRVWHLADFPGICFYRGTGVSHRFPRHWHDELHLCAYTSGSGYYGYRGESHRVSPGDLVVTPAGEVHENWVGDGHSIGFRSLYITPPAMREVSRHLIGNDSEVDFRLLTLRNSSLENSFMRMHRAMESSESRLLREERLLAFLWQLLASHAEHGERPRLGNERAAVRRVRHFIDEHFGESISLENLGRLAQLSPFHLHSVFSREIGMPPHAYQTQVRINHARALLRLGRPLAEIALATGFADQSHFTRHFRRLVGVTPGHFAHDRQNDRNISLDSRDRKNVQDELPLSVEA